MNKTRKVHVKSFGCQMNVYDSHRMADTLAPAGYAETAASDEADLVILNTCHIREKAAEKVYSEIGRMRVLKEEAAAQGRKMLIAVAGCVAQAEGAEIVRRRRQRRPGGRLAELSPPARADRARRIGRARGRHRVSGRRQIRRAGAAAVATPSPSAASPASSPCRKAATSSARSASCPIRAAPRSRARSARSSPRWNGWPRPACAKSR